MTDTVPLHRRRFWLRVLVTPLACLVAGWATIVATASSGSTPVADAASVTDVPPAALVATQPVPSSRRSDPLTAPVSSLSIGRAAANVQAGDIASGALAAYQRAATIINATDKSCGLGWELIAAIGQVESHHGTYGGSRLDEDGVARPAIIGIPLDGRNNTRRIADTDAGQYDGDQRFDRAVGPMQFIPSTWALIGVDGDADGQRNPQDIDDAALATAIHLCSGEGDLTRPRDRAAALLRYNHSQAYVDLVLSVMAQYEKTPTLAMPTGYYAGAPTSLDVQLLSSPLPPVKGAQGPGEDGKAHQSSAGTDLLGQVPSHHPPTTGGPGRPGSEAGTTPVGDSSSEPATPPTDDPSDEPSTEPSPTDEPVEPTDDPTEPTGSPADQPAAEEPVAGPAEDEAMVEPATVEPAPVDLGAMVPAIENAVVACTLDGTLDEACLSSQLDTVCSEFGYLTETGEQCRIEAASYAATVSVP